VIESNESNGAVTFRVRVVPRASKTAVAGEFDGALKVRISAPPVDGAANGELVRFIAKHLGVPKASVEIAGGGASKTKLVRVAGLTAADLAEKLQ
jgi:hypothetical protein